MDHKSSGPSSRCALVAIELHQFRRRQAAAAVVAATLRPTLPPPRRRCVTVEPLSPPCRLICRSCIASHPLSGPLNSEVPQVC
mgnify:CR=1 FL=1